MNLTFAGMVVPVEISMWQEPGVEKQCPTISD